MQTKPRKHCVCYVNARAGFFFFLRLDDATDVHALLKAARAELDRLGHPEYKPVEIWTPAGARVTRLQAIQPDSILVVGCGEPFNPASVPDRARAMQRRADATAVTREREGFAREREALSRLQRELPAELDLVPPPPPLVPEAPPRITHGGRLLTDLEVQRFKHVQQAAVAEAVAATRGTHRTDVLPYSSPKPFVPKLAWVGSHSGRWRTDDVRRAQMADTKREGTGAKAEVLSRRVLEQGHALEAWELALLKSESRAARHAARVGRPRGLNGQLI